MRSARAMRPAAAGFIAAALCAASFADVGPGEPPPRSHAAGVPAPAETPVRIAARGGPLIIEVALIPEPGSGPCGEAPAGQREYFEEAGDCLRIGASMIRLQPIAPGGGPGGHRYDRGLANYREVVRGCCRRPPRSSSTSIWTALPMRPSNGRGATAVSSFAPRGEGGRC